MEIPNMMFVSGSDNNNHEYNIKIRWDTKMSNEKLCVTVYIIYYYYRNNLHPVLHSFFKKLIN